MSFKADDWIILASWHREGVPLPNKFESFVVTVRENINNDTVAMIPVRSLEISPTQAVRGYIDRAVRVEVE